MSDLRDIRKSINTSIINVLNEVKKMKELYDDFFNFEFIFSNDNSGKTRLFREFFEKNHEKIKIHIDFINNEFADTLKIIENKMLSFLHENGFSEVYFPTFVYDDSLFNEHFMLDLQDEPLSDEQKEDLVSNIKTLSDYKNKIYNFEYFISMFDTDNSTKYLNKLGLDDLINSKLVFEAIDTYALQFEELKSFENNLNNFYEYEEEIKDLRTFDTPIELLKRRLDTFMHDNVRYKINIEYINEVKLNKGASLKKAYLENIMANFVLQSCNDLIKKELKRGKIQKLIDIKLFQTKNSIQLVVKNNGFEEKNIHMMYIGLEGNKYIIEARNLARMMNATVDVASVEGEGMQYIFDLRI